MSGLRTWFLEDYDGDSDQYLHYGTREHGIRDEDSDRAGPADIAEAKRIREALRTEFGSALKVSIDPVDEWTNISLTWR